MTKKIEAIIREDKLDEIKHALHDIGIVGLNVTEVRGHGRQGGITLNGRTGPYQIDLLPRIQLNIVLSDHNVGKTVETIQQVAQTGQIGDGIIFIYPVEEVIRIRTGERGAEALMYTDDIDARSQLDRAARNRVTISTDENAAAATNVAGSVLGEPGKRTGRRAMVRLASWVIAMLGHT